MKNENKVEMTERQQWDYYILGKEPVEVKPKEKQKKKK